VSGHRVRDGRVSRAELRCEVAGGCQTCGEQWSGPIAFLMATRHTEATGHQTVAGRTVVYRYGPVR
jgi:hypothetical protein